MAVTVPFLFSGSTLDPVLNIRYFVLSTVVLLFFTYFFLLKKSPAIVHTDARMKALLVAATGYVLWSFVCGLSAVNFGEAFYESARSLLNFILLFAVAVAAGKEPGSVMQLCKALTVAALLHGAVGILQYYGLAFRDIPGGALSSPNDPHPSWPHGLMANRNLFGSAMVLLLPFALFVWYKCRKMWRAVAVCSLIILTASVLLSQTRSAWVAAAVCGGTAFFLFFMGMPQKRKRLVRIGSLVFTAALLAVSLVLLTSRGGPSSNPLTTRLFSFAALSQTDASASGRLTLWSKSWQLLREHPVFGVGPGNWKLAIPAYGSEGTLWADGLVLPSYPHNVYLQTICETGWPGALFYFGLWALLGTMALKVIREKALEENRVLIILMAAGLAAFATDCLFSFPTERIEHCLYAALMAGIVLGLYSSRLPPASKSLPMPPWIKLFLVCGLVFNVFLGYEKYNFEKHARLAKIFRLQKDLAAAIEETAASKNAWVTLDAAGEPPELQSAAAYAELGNFDKALKEIETAQSRHPNSARIYTTKGVILANLQATKEAIEAYRKALALAPRYAVALQNIAGLYFKTGNYAACVETLERLNNKSSFYPASLYNLAKQRMQEGRK